MTAAHKIQIVPFLQPESTVSQLPTAVYGTEIYIYLWGIK